MSEYKTEVKEKWGDTAAYKEHIQKTSGYSKEKWQDVTDGLNAVFVKFTECKNNGFTVDSDEAQTLVKELQNYITDNYYTCTNEILAGLGKMYVTDERFKTNIEQHSPGTSEFVSAAIEFYCK